MDKEAVERTTPPRAVFVAPGMASRAATARRRTGLGIHRRIRRRAEHGRLDR
jgi:hypothetical protein